MPSKLYKQKGGGGGEVRTPYTEVPPPAPDRMERDIPGDGEVYFHGAKQHKPRSSDHYAFSSADESRTSSTGGTARKQTKSHGKGQAGTPGTGGMGAGKPSVSVGVNRQKKGFGAQVKGK